MSIHIPTFCSSHNCDVEKFFNAWEQVASSISENALIEGLSNSKTLHLIKNSKSLLTTHGRKTGARTYRKVKICRNCGETGHSRKECKACWGCGKLGHSRRNCPQSITNEVNDSSKEVNGIEMPEGAIGLETSGSDFPYLSSMEEQRICYRCNAVGHIAKLCPTRVSQTPDDEPEAGTLYAPRGDVALQPSKCSKPVFVFPQCFDFMDARC
mmetsp:Transcript_534/g.868  ORF Transcript_534/g.868 Transcript_534/m.868 type:complete len:211 (-) Transcript_534:391-1023(-)